MDTLKPFIFGGISGIVATSCIQPIDTVKVRIQIVGETAGKGAKIGPLAIGKDILNKEGLNGLYKGIDSAIFRQITYGTARLGTFTFLNNRKIQELGGKKPDLLTNAGYAVTAGFIASMIGNPADLVLVRFQSDSSLPEADRRGYKNVFDAFRRVVKEEGLYTLWRGASPTVGRAVSLTLGQMASFPEFKKLVNGARGLGAGEEDVLTRIVASSLAGVVCAAFSLPFDNLKTKLQKMKTGVDGSKPYSGLFDCFRKSVAREGVTGLWIGLPTYIIRIAPHSIISLLVLDYLNYFFIKKNNAQSK